MSPWTSVRINNDFLSCMAAIGCSFNCTAMSTRCYIQWIFILYVTAHAHIHHMYLKENFNTCFPSCFSVLNHELEQRRSRCEARVWLWRIFSCREKRGASTSSKVSHIVRTHRIRRGVREEPAAPIILQDRDEKSKFWWGKRVSIGSLPHTQFSPGETDTVCHLWYWMSIFVVFNKIFWRWRRGVRQQRGSAVHSCREFTHSAADAVWWRLRQWGRPTGCLHGRSWGEERIGL